MQCLRSLCGSSLPLWSHYVRMLGGSRRWVPTAWLVFCSAAGGFHNSLGLAQFGCTGQWRPRQASHLSRDRLAHVQHREGSFLSLCRPGGDMISLCFLMAYTRLKVWISDHFFVFFCYGAFFEDFARFLPLGRSLTMQCKVEFNPDLLTEAIMWNKFV